MYNLSFNCLIFDSFLNSFLWNVFHILIIDNSFLNSLLWDIFNVCVLEYLRKIFGLIFDCVIICNSSLFRDVFGSRKNYYFFNTFKLLHIPSLPFRKERIRFCFLLFKVVKCFRLKLLKQVMRLGVVRLMRLVIIQQLLVVIQLKWLGVALKRLKHIVLELERLILDIVCILHKDIRFELGHMNNSKELRQLVVLEFKMLVLRIYYVKIICLQLPFLI